jgi:hypothetical protein
LTIFRVRYGPAMTPDYAPSLLRSFERHLRAENRSDNTIESYLESIRQAETFLASRGRTLLDARRADLEAFLGELLRRRAPATAATRYKVLRIGAAAVLADLRSAPPSAAILACPACHSGWYTRMAHIYQSTLDRS